MVNKLVDLLSYSSDLFNSIHIDVLKQLVDLIILRDLLDQSPDELYEVFVLVVDTEEQAVKEGHGVLLDIARVVGYAVNNLQIESLFLFSSLFAKSICFLKPVGDFMVEVYFLSEDLVVVLLHCGLL